MLTQDFSQFLQISDSLAVVFEAKPRTGNWLKLRHLCNDGIRFLDVIQSRRSFRSIFLVLRSLLPRYSNIKPIWPFCHAALQKSAKCMQQVRKVLSVTCLIHNEMTSSRKYVQIVPQQMKQHFLVCDQKEPEIVTNVFVKTMHAIPFLLLLCISMPPDVDNDFPIRFTSVTFHCITTLRYFRTHETASLPFFFFRVCQFFCLCSFLFSRNCSTGERRNYLHCFVVISQTHGLVSQVRLATVARISMFIE